MIKTLNQAQENNHNHTYYINNPRYVIRAIINNYVMNACIVMVKGYIQYFDRPRQRYLQHEYVYTTAHLTLKCYYSCI